MLIKKITLILLCFLPLYAYANYTKSQALTDLQVHGVANALYTGTVERVFDGDTIRVRLQRTQAKDAPAQLKVRLIYIDSPELDQQGGKQAKQALTKRLLRKYISIQTFGQDQYGRTLGVVWLKNEEVNGWLVANGYAWVYTRYLVDNNHAYIALQRQAKSKKLGLWSNESAVAPWQWRQSKKKLITSPQ